MSEFISTISIGDFSWQLLWVTIGASLPLIGQWCYQKICVRPRYSRVFPVGNGKKLNCIIPTLQNPDFEALEYIDYTTALESVMNVQFINSILDKVNIPVDSLKVIFSKGASHEDLESNLILIGGPQHNGWTREYIKVKSHKLYFDNHDLVSGYSSNKYQAEVIGGRVVKDYAMLCITNNPWSRNNKTVLVAGCRGYGSIGILKHACSGELLDLIYKHPNFIKSSDLHAVFSFQVSFVGKNTFTFSNLRCEELTCEAEI